MLVFQRSRSLGTVDLTIADRGFRAACGPLVSRCTSLPVRTSSGPPKYLEPCPSPRERPGTAGMTRARACRERKLQLRLD